MQDDGSGGCGCSESAAGPPRLAVPLLLLQRRRRRWWKLSARSALDGGDSRQPSARRRHTRPTARSRCVTQWEMEVPGDGRESERVCGWGRRVLTPRQAPSRRQPAATSRSKVGERGERQCTTTDSGERRVHRESGEASERGEGVCAPSLSLPLYWCQQPPGSKVRRPAAAAQELPPPTTCTQRSPSPSPTTTTTSSPATSASSSSTSKQQQWQQQQRAAACVLNSATGQPTQPLYCRTGPKLRSRPAARAATALPGPSSSSTSSSSPAAAARPLVKPPGQQPVERERGEGKQSTAAFSTTVQTTRTPSHPPPPALWYRRFEVGYPLPVVDRPAPTRSDRCVKRIIVYSGQNQCGRNGGLRVREKQTAAAVHAARAIELGPAHPRQP